MTFAINYPGAQAFNLSIKPTGKGRVRLGKTQKDKQSGAIAQNAMNRQARGDWSRDGGEFPTGTCNGKKAQALRNRPSKRSGRK